MFFLLNRGRGYTDVGVKQMTVPEMLRHAQELSKILEEENSAREEAAQKMRQRMESARRRH